MDEKTTIEKISRRKAASYTIVFGYFITALNIVINIALVPLYINYLGLSTYGAWLASSGIVSLLGGLDGGMVQVFIQRLAVTYGAGEKVLFSKIAGSGGVITICICLVFGLIGSGIAQMVPEWVHVDPNQAHSLYIAFSLTVIGTVLTLAQTMVLSVFYAMQRTVVPGIINVGGMFIQVCGTIFFLLTGWGVIALGIGVFSRGIFSVFFALLISLILWKKTGIPYPSVDLKEMKNLLISTAPVFLSRTAGTIMNNCEATIISVLANPKSAAIMALTSRVFSVGQMIVSIFSGAFYPGIAHLLGDRDIKRVHQVIAEIMKFTVILSAMVLGPMFAMNAGFVSLWVGRENFAGQAINLAFLASSLLIIRSNYLVLMLTALGEFRSIGLSTVLELVIRIFLIYILLTWYGLIGVPLAAFVGTILVSFWYLPKIYCRKMGLEIRNIFNFATQEYQTIIAVVLLNLAAARILPLPGNWGSFIFQGTLLYAATLLIILITSEFSRKQAIRFYSFLLSYRASGT